MRKLRIHLTGAFGLTAPDAAAVTIETRKARALLAILVMAHGRAIPREKLAGMLWSQGASRQALASLSQALYSLRRAVEPYFPDLIEAGVDSISLDATVLDTDISRIEAARGSSDPGVLQDAITAYSGPFLDDLAIDREEAFSDWRAAEQARIADLVTASGAVLMEQWEAHPAQARMDTVDKLLEVDPYSEAALRVKLRMLIDTGRRAAAVDAAERYRVQLHADLGITPSVEVEAILSRHPDHVCFVERQEHPLLVFGNDRFSH